MQFAADGVPTRKEGKRERCRGRQGAAPFLNSLSTEWGRHRANDLLYHGLYHRREKGKEIKRKIHRKEWWKESQREVCTGASLYGLSMVARILYAS